jgi:hypothetical protein
MPPRLTLGSWFCRALLLFASALLAVLTVACTRTSPPDEVVIAVPANFDGQVHIEMGVPGAPSLKREGNHYQIAIPPDGKVVTSTLVAGVTPKFMNVDANRIWGYTPSVSKTGDGLPVGGAIEFFVGTKEQYENAEAKKHKSKLYPSVSPAVQIEGVVHDFRPFGKNALSS